MERTALKNVILSNHQTDRPINMKTNLHKMPLLRKTVLWILKACNKIDVHIKHPYTGSPFLVNVYKHKGYWYHRRSREEDTMRLFAQLVRQNDTVLEVGGHIGFIAAYLAKLAAPGQLIVFEPGPDNLSYLKANVKSCGNVSLREVAVGASEGKVDFHVENITGQNNSVLPNYQTFENNAKMAFTKASYTKVVVQMVTLDAFCARSQLTPNFVKIDVEGYEEQVITGMREILLHAHPICMIEVTENAEAVFRLLSGAGYKLYNAKREQLCKASMLCGNVFALHAMAHEMVIRAVFSSRGNPD